MVLVPVWQWYLYNLYNATSTTITMVHVVPLQCYWYYHDNGTGASTATDRQGGIPHRVVRARPSAPISVTITWHDDVTTRRHRVTSRRHRVTSRRRAHAYNNSRTRARVRRRRAIGWSRRANAFDWWAEPGPRSGHARCTARDKETGRQKTSRSHDPSNGDYNNDGRYTLIIIDGELSQNALWEPSQEPWIRPDTIFAYDGTKTINFITI